VVAELVLFLLAVVAVVDRELMEQLAVLGTLLTAELVAVEVVVQMRQLDLLVRQAVTRVVVAVAVVAVLALVGPVVVVAAAKFGLSAGKNISQKRYKCHTKALGLMLK
jgi:hypothetical protein